jgi:predicted transcriptional regulator
MWALENHYDDNLQCDRIQNHLGYYPENCRWVTAEENCANRRRSIILPTGETTAQAAQRLGVSPATIRNRLRNMKLTPQQSALMPKLFGGQCKHFKKSIGKWEGA